MQMMQRICNGTRQNCVTQFFCWLILVYCQLFYLLGLVRIFPRASNMTTISWAQEEGLRIYYRKMSADISREWYRLRLGPDPGQLFCYWWKSALLPPTTITIWGPFLLRDTPTSLQCSGVLVIVDVHAVNMSSTFQLYPLWSPGENLFAVLWLGRTGCEHQVGPRYEGVVEGEIPRMTILTREPKVSLR